MAGRLVLVVEDDRDTREILCELLEMEGYEVLPAASGEEALAVLERGVRPCALVLDMVLPGLDGWQLLKLLKSTPTLAAIPIIAISAAVGRVPYDAEAFVRKPFELTELVEVLERNQVQADAG